MREFIEHKALYNKFCVFYLSNYCLTLVKNFRNLTNIFWCGMFYTISILFFGGGKCGGSNSLALKVTIGTRCHQATRPSGILNTFAFDVYILHMIYAYYDYDYQYYYFIEKKIIWSGNTDQRRLLDSLRKLPPHVPSPPSPRPRTRRTPPTPQ